MLQINIISLKISAIGGGKVHYECELNTATYLDVGQ